MYQRLTYRLLTIKIMTTCVIMQSNYIPWKGYFDLINEADIFVFYDIVQYTKNDWRNRNRIKPSTGSTWMTIPVSVNSDTKINEVVLPIGKWRNNHLKTIWFSYSPAPYMEDTHELLEKRLGDSSINMLSELNQLLIKDFSEYLGIETEFIDARELAPEGNRVDRLIDICNKVGADVYLSGPAAKSYAKDEFANSEVEIKWMEYGPYPEYSQLCKPFEHDVSIIDLIAHTGPKAREFIFLDK